MSKQIPLTQGKYAIVDDEDFEYLSQRKWYAAKNGRTFYAQTGRCTLMHREVMKCQDDMVVDHINRDGLDNTKANLRTCTKADNTKNTSPYSKNGYKGVVFNGSSYVAHCKGVYLGSFDNSIDAANAYDVAAKKEYGDFAYQNKAS